MGQRFLTIGMDEVIRHYNPGDNRHWFDKDTLRFFKSRISETAYANNSKEVAYFVTSEQSPHGTRKYTVRMYDFRTRQISNASNFGQYASRSGATSAAQTLAAFQQNLP